MVEVGKWVHGSSENSFYSETFDTKKKAKQAGQVKYRKTQKFFYVAQVDEVAAGVRADVILDQVREGVMDQCGNVAAEFLKNVGRKDADELEKRMEQALRDWMEEFGYNPVFFPVCNVSKVRVKSAKNRPMVWI